MDNPNFTILAHPTGRMIEQREPYDVDMLRIIRHARARGCFLELNAHSILDFDNLRFGVGQARRGWLAAADVLNTRPLGQLRPLLARGQLDGSHVNP